MPRQLEKATEQDRGKRGLRRWLEPSTRPPGAAGGQPAGTTGGDDKRTTALDHPLARSTATFIGYALLFVAVQQYFWPAPIGVLVQGTIIGGLTALIAFGISLVYRANRVINFAQGDLGAVPAILAVLLIVGPGWPYFVALPVGILSAIALGAVVEFVVIRRFFKSPRLIFTVATIALGSLLAGMGAVLPRFFDINTPPQSFPSPFDFSFEIDPIIFRGNDIIAMLAVGTAIAFLFAFFRYTNIGIAVRGAAESGERASLLGIPVKRIQMIVWVIATCLASTAIFMRAGIVGLPIGTVLGPAILLRALAACVIGRMDNLPRIFVAAVALGVVEQAIIWETGRSILVAPVLFLMILGALLFQRRGVVTRADDMSNWEAASDVRPVPQELARLPEIIWVGRGATAFFAAVALSLPLLLPESRINLIAVVMIFAMVVVSLVVLTGWAGQVSLGQVAFLGVGAAIGGAITEHWNWDISFALLGAGLAGAVVAIVIGLPALRIKGLFLAITTLAFAHAMGTYFLSRDTFSWLPTSRLPRNPLFGLISIDTETRYYYFTLACLVLVILAVNRLRRGRPGRVLVGIRENERAAQAYGINATSAKLTAFAISGFIAAFAGGLFVHHQQGLGIQPFGTEQSLSVFVMAVVGGIASVPGALLGAAFFRGGLYFLPPEFRFFIEGAGLLFILIVLPGGLGSLIYRGRDSYLRWVADRRKILVPSLIADARDLSAIPSGRDKGLEFLREMADGIGKRPAVAAAASAETEDAGDLLAEISDAVTDVEPDPEPVTAGRKERRGS